MQSIDDLVQHIIAGDKNCDLILREATKRIVKDCFYASRLRTAGEEALGGVSLIEFCVQRAAKEKNHVLMSFAGAIAGAAGATPRELRCMLALAGQVVDQGVSKNNDLAPTAVRALRLTLHAAAHRRSALGPCRGAYFDMNQQGIELPALPWPLGSSLPGEIFHDSTSIEKANKEYALSLWLRLEIIESANYDQELIRLCTKNTNSGLILRLRWQNNRATLCLEAGHEPQAHSRVAQTLQLTLPRFQPNKWHHIHLEARGKPRLSLFGRDELSAWLDGKILTERASFLFPCFIPNGKLDDCALGRGFKGQLSQIALFAEVNAAAPLRNAAAVLDLAGKNPTSAATPSSTTASKRRSTRASSQSDKKRASSSYGLLADEYLDEALCDAAPVLAARYEARLASSTIAYDASPHHRDARLDAIAIAVPDAVDSLSALGGVWLLVALFLLKPNLPSGLLLQTLSVAVARSGVMASELARLRHLTLIEHILAKKENDSKAIVVSAVLRLLRCVASPPLAAQVLSRLIFSSVWFPEADERLDAMLAVTASSPRTVDALIGITRLIDLARSSKRPRARKVLLAAAGILILATGLSRNDARALLAAIASGHRRQRRGKALARDSAKLLLSLLGRKTLPKGIPDTLDLAVVEHSEATVTNASIHSANEDDSEETDASEVLPNLPKKTKLPLEAYCVVALVDTNSERLRALGLRLVSARLALYPPDQLDTNFEALAPLLTNVLSTRARELREPAYTTLFEMATSLGGGAYKSDFLHTRNQSDDSTTFAPPPEFYFDDIWTDLGGGSSSGGMGQGANDSDANSWYTGENSSTLSDEDDESPARIVERDTRRRRRVADSVIVRLVPEPTILARSRTRVAAAAPLGLFLRIVPKLSPAIGLRVLADLETLLTYRQPRAQLAANRDCIPCCFGLAKNSSPGEDCTKRFGHAVRIYATLLIELLPKSFCADAIALSVACARSEPDRRTLRSVLAHTFARLLEESRKTQVSFNQKNSVTIAKLTQSHIIQLVFVAASLVNNRDGRSSGGQQDHWMNKDFWTSFNALQVDDDDVANVLLAIQTREFAGHFLLSGRDLLLPEQRYLPGGLRSVAPRPRDGHKRAAALPTLFSTSGALPGQECLVFELLRLCANVTLSALHPATAQAAVNLGWTRFLLAAVLDVCDNAAENRHQALRTVRRDRGLFCGVDVDLNLDSLEGNRKQAVAWTLATVSYIRNALAASRELFFGDIQSVRKTSLRRVASDGLLAAGAVPTDLLSATSRAAAVSCAREASSALVDALTRQSSPLPRFVGASTLAAMRQMLDESQICRTLARKLKFEEDEERREATGAKWHIFSPDEDDDDDALLVTAFDASVDLVEETKSSTVRSRKGNDEQSRRLAELRWLKVAWLSDETATDDVPRLRMIADKVSTACRASGTKGLDQASGIGARACADRAEKLVPHSDTEYRKTNTRRQRDIILDAADAFHVSRYAAMRLDARAARISTSRLKAAAQRPGWSPFVHCQVPRSPRCLRVSTTHRDALSRRLLLVRQSRFKAHADESYDSKSHGSSGLKSTGLLMPPALNRVESAAVSSITSFEDNGMWSSSDDAYSAKNDTDDDSSVSSEQDTCCSESSDSDHSEVEGPVRSVSRGWVLPSTESCFALYDNVILVEAAGVIRGNLRMTPLHIYFVANDIKYKRLRWRLDTLTTVRGRRYLLKRTALELFFVNRQEVFFSFSTVHDCRQSWRKLKKYATIPLVTQPPGGSKGLSDPRIELRTSGLVELWKTRQITNFEYLMSLNTLAGRCYNDLTQYFVFPWVIQDYTSSSLSKIPRNIAKTISFQHQYANDQLEELWDQMGDESARFYRDLSKPIGALNEARLEVFKERYESADFMYGSHYSSAGTVLHFLVRAEPYTSRALELFGGNFDVADRLFFSLPASWQNGTTSASDVKELVPELFYQPSILRNDNMYPFGALQDGRAVDGVELPAWCPDAESFVRANRAALESKYVDDKLPRWIDIIFGYCANRSPDAEKCFNIFHPYCYEGGINVDDIDDETLKQAVEAQITHFGQVPLQLFDTPHPSRAPRQSGDLTTLRASSSRAIPSALFENDNDDECVLAGSNAFSYKSNECTSNSEKAQPTGHYFVYKIFPPSSTEAPELSPTRTHEQPLHPEEDNSQNPMTGMDTVLEGEDEFVDLDLNDDSSIVVPVYPRSPPPTIPSTPLHEEDTFALTTDLSDFVLGSSQSSSTSSVAALYALQNQKLAVVHSDQTILTLKYQIRPGTARLETKRELFSRDLPEISTQSKTDFNIQSGRYGFVQATLGGSASSGSQERKTFAKNHSVTSLCLPHPGVGDASRLISVRYLDGAVRCHGVFTEDKYERIATRRSNASRSSGATCVATSSCGRFVVTGHADGTVTVWINEYSDLAKALASDDVLVSTARGHHDGLGAAALQSWRLHAHRERMQQRSSSKEDSKKERESDEWGFIPKHDGGGSPDDDVRLRAALAVIDQRLLSMSPLQLEHMAMVSESSTGQRTVSLPSKIVSNAPSRNSALNWETYLARALDRELRGRAAAAARADSPLAAVHVLRGADTPVISVAVRSDVDLLLAATVDGSLFLHTLRRGRFVRVLDPIVELSSSQSNQSHLCELSPHGYLVSACVVATSTDLSTSSTTILRSFSINDPKPLAIREVAFQVNAITLSRSGDYLVVAGDAPSLHVHYLHDLRLIHKIPLSGLEDQRTISFASVTSLTFSQSHDLLFFGTTDGAIHVCARSLPS